MRVASGVGRLVAAVVGICALAAHLVYSLGSGGSALPNFFSYFTMQSAILAVLLWAIGGVLALRRATDPEWLASCRLLVTTYQVVSGIVYTIIVLESVSRGLSIQVPPSSQVLHYWMPAFALLDWLGSPGRGHIRWRSLRTVLVFPLVWGGYTLVRGSMVGWYPYFFLDPFQVSWPWEFTGYCAIVLAFIVGVGALLVAASRVLPRYAEDGDGRPGGRGRSDSGVGERPPRRGTAPQRTAALAGVDGDERLEAEPGAQHDFVVAEVGEGDGALATHEPHHDR